MSASIKLHFFYVKKNIDRYKLAFQKEIQPIDKNIINIDIPEIIFKYGKDKRNMSITLYTAQTNIQKEFNFHVYYGNNSAYVQLDKLYYNSYEIILRNNEKLNIYGDENYFTELDTIGNIDKKRLVLINYGVTFLKINEINLDLHKITFENCQSISSSSFQLSEVDYKTSKFIVKQFQENKEYNFDLLIKNKDKLQNFADELFEVKDYKIDLYNKRIEEIFDDYNNIETYDNIYFNKTNEYLNNIFDKNQNYSLDLFFNYFLFLYFNEHKDLFINQRTIQINFVQKLKELSDEIADIKGISKSEKISAVNALFLTNGNLESLDDLIKLNVRYYYMKDIIENTNSILERVQIFLKQFIDGLNEKSVIYDNLLYIDGGSGYYKGEKVYTYDMTNLDMLKSHLREIFPKILIFCYMNNNEESFTTPEFYGIVLNEKFLLKNYENNKFLKDFEYDREIINNYEKITPDTITAEEFDDIAMNIIIDLIHEMMGHKKNSLTEPGNQSPKKIINKKNEIIELKYYKEIEQNNNNNINDNSEYILTSNNGKGDSGHFLELSYGKIDNDLVMKLLFQMKNKGKLIHRPDLFIDDGKKLKQFVYLRNFIKKNQIIYNFDNDMEVEDEIKEMEILINTFKNQENENKNKTKVNEEKKQVIKEIKTKEQKEVIKDEEIIEKKEKNKEFLNKKRNEKFNENFEVPSKRVKLNKIDLDENLCSIKDIENNMNNTKELSFSERVKNKTHKEVVEMCKKRVMERFNLKLDEKLRDNLIKLTKKLDKKDPYYEDLFIVIGDLRRIV